MALNTYAASFYLFTLGAYGKALTYAEKAYANGGREPEPVSLLAIIHFEMGHDAEALRYFTELEAMQPGYGHAYAYRARMYERQHKPAEAVLYWQKYVAGHPEEIRVYWQLGDNYWNMQQYDEACGWYEKYYAVQPENIVFLLHLANRYRELPAMQRRMNG